MNKEGKVVRLYPVQKILEQPSTLVSTVLQSLDSIDKELDDYWKSIQLKK